MKISFKNGVTLVFMLVGIYSCYSQNENPKFNWPETVGSMVTQDFIQAYNSGSNFEMRKFVLEHYNYSELDQSKINETVEEWMDLFYRYGPIRPHSISINKEYDIEVWMECTISKNWFAPEFILSKQTGKIRATGLLQGEQPKGMTNPSKNKDELLKLTEQYLNENTEADLFQGVVLIQKDQQTIFHKAYGHSNKELNSSNSLDTRMRLSSITKPITVLACLQLVQNGYLELDKPISNYLPELPSEISDKINVKSLIMHTSGYELDNIQGFREELEKTKSMQEVYAAQLKYLSKWEKYETFDPKGNYDYSNDSFDLLAIIIEKITGITFQEYLNRYIFQVAGMTNTSFLDNDVATPYRYDFKAGGLSNYTEHYPFSVGNISGAAGLKSTTEDVSKFFNMLFHSDELLDLPIKNLMFSLLLPSNTASNPDVLPNTFKNGEMTFVNAPKVKNGRSMGFSIFYDTHLSYGHNGTSIGNSAELRYFPHNGYLMIVLCNNRSGAQNFFRFFNNHLPKPK